MGWERKGSRKVYCLSERVPGSRRVRRTYVGSGPLAKMAALGDRIQEAERRQAACSKAAWRHAIRASNRAFAAFRVAIRLKERFRTPKEDFPMRPFSDRDLETLTALAEKAHAGSAESRAELDRFLAGHPDMVHQLGDIGRIAEAAWVKLISDLDPVLAVSVPASLENRRQSLLSRDADALERLVVDQICLTWMQSNYISAYTTENATSIKFALFLHREHLRALKRFEAALKSLMTLRKGPRASSRRPARRSRPRTSPGTPKRA
jgi:hypothetical protein